MIEPKVIHVDKDDKVIDYVPKLKAHQEGLLHRAISVQLFNSKGEWLLQRRAKEKYHSSHLWSNTCCSHPYPDESVEDAAGRRLKEEMGLTCDLHKAFTFMYTAELDNGLIENEIDHVFLGVTEDIPRANPAEVSAWRFIDIEQIENELDQFPEDFTAWFKILIPMVRNHLSEIDQD